MNNKFKRALSSILAFIMLCSCLCVMNVSSVLAELSASDVTEYVYTTTGHPSALASQSLTYYLAANGASKISTDVTGVWAVSTTTAGTANTKNSGKFFNSDSAVYSSESKSPVMSITIRKAGTLYIDWVSDGNKGLLDLIDSNNKTTTLGSKVASNNVNATGVQSQITISEDNIGTYTLQKETASMNKDYYLCALAFVPDDDTDEGDEGDDDDAAQVIAIGTSKSYSFGSITNTSYNDVALPAMGDKDNHLAAYDSADGYVKIAGELSCNQTIEYDKVEKDNPHGLYFNTDGTIKFSVEGNATIKLGLCKHNNTKSQTITVAAGAENATVTPSSFGNDGETDGAKTDIAYKGGEGTVTITVPAGTYIHSLDIDVTGIVFSDYQGEDITVDATAADAPENNTFSSVVNAVKAIKTYYGDTCDGVTVNIKNGTYRGRIDIETPNVILKGESTNDVIIVDNANEANNYVEGLYGNTFHGDTVAVFADGFKAETLTIMNDSELDFNLGTSNTAAVYYTDGNKHYSYTKTDDLTTEKTGNGTAFSIGNKDNMSGTATLTNVRILATRDTVYTGKATADTAIVFDSCTIYGFQDVICGAGDATLNNCTWNVNSGKNARFFAPMADSIYKATNLNIVNSNNSKNYTKSTFARAWGDGTSTVIIDGYTDSKNNIIADGTTISGSNTSVYGFETQPVTGDADITTMFWAARKTGEDYFHTTLTEADTDTNTLDTDLTGYVEADEAYKIVGKINSDIVDKVNEIGFVLHNGDKSVKLASDTVYADDDAYYFVMFATGNDANLEATFKPYVSYTVGGVDYSIEGKNTTEATYTFATATSDAE